jgi:saccharopine dehydrogenase-like NADP-dependent oxidoreductase
MADVIVVGAGKIGSTIARLLAATPDYHVTVVDRSKKRLSEIATGPTLSAAQLDIADHAALTSQLSGKFAVLSAAPFQFTVTIADAAAKAGVHYLDLTEDVESTRRVKLIAHTAKSAFIPQCGLAPGFISIVASELVRKFDSLDSVQLRVGALPRFPSNALNYNLTWSTDGVINEYIQPCEAIVNGKLVEVPALEEREEFSLDGICYEAFNTSGGLGTLCETLEGKVSTLNYRTIRYPGHAAIMKVLLHDLGLRHRRDVLKDVLEHALPTTIQDVVIVFVTVSGRRDGRFIQESYANKIHSTEIGYHTASAIQVTTASSICAILDLLAGGKIPGQGFIRQEDIRLDAFLENRFGVYYRQGEAAKGYRVPVARDGLAPLANASYHPVH